MKLWSTTCLLNINDCNSNPNNVIKKQVFILLPRPRFITVLLYENSFGALIAFFLEKIDLQLVNYFMTERRWYE